jgi:hypothetical protein
MPRHSGPDGAQRSAQVTRAEWRWVVVAATAVMALTCVPYLFGWFITPPGWRYMGLLANPDEHNVYLGWMREAERGHAFFFDPLTTEPQRAQFFQVFFLVLGAVARVTHAPLIWVYHAARVIAGMLLLVGVYGLAAQMLDSRLARRLAWALVAFSSGFGWIYALAMARAPVAGGAAPNPIDYGAGLVMPEAITFLSLLLNPLFCLSVWLMVAVWTTYLAALRGRARRLVALAAAAGLVLGNVHTYNVITVWVTIAGYVVMAGIIARRWPLREAVYGAVVVVACAPGVLYQYWLFRVNEVFRLKALTLTLTPPAAYFLLGYGLVLALAIPGAVMALRREGRAPPLKQHTMEPTGRSASVSHCASPETLLVVWAVVTLGLVFLAPFSFQRKLAEGLHVPLCLLAALFAGEWLAPKLRRGGGALAIAVIILTMPSNLFFVARGLHNLVNNNAAYIRVLMPPLYLPSDTVAAITWLRRNSAMSEAVLCMPLEGSYIPGAAGNKVFVGHWAETLRYPDKLGQVRWFFSDQPRAGQRRDFMTRNGLTWVLYTQNEAALGPFNPAASADFEAVFTRPGATLFRLRPGSL